MLNKLSEIEKIPLTIKAVKNSHLELKPDSIYEFLYSEPFVGVFLTRTCAIATFYSSIDYPYIPAQSRISNNENIYYSEPNILSLSHFVLLVIALIEIFS